MVNYKNIEVALKEKEENNKAIAKAKKHIEYLEAENRNISFWILKNKC